MNQALYDKPHFMVIGAQKSGTSWIYQYFRGHTGINSLPVKEFHFFDECEMAQSNFFKRKRDAFIKCLIFSVLRLQPRYISWGATYALTRRDFSSASMSSYASLFKGNKPAGDITPAYAILSKETVANIHKHFPDIKIIYIMRNPVERFWGATKMHFLEHKKISSQDLTDDMIMQHFNKVDIRNDYLHTMNTWESFYPRDNIFYGFYDELRSDPGNFIGSIENFLGLPHGGDQEKLGKKYNKSEPLPLKEEHEKYLYSHFYPMLQALAQKFENASTNYPSLWLEKADQVLGIS